MPSGGILLPIRGQETYRLDSTLAAAGGAGRSQEKPGGARRSQEETGGDRRRQEEPGGARRSQEEPCVLV